MIMKLPEYLGGIRKLARTLLLFFALMLSDAWTINGVNLDSPHQGEAL
jgi:hypothetical protein